MCGVLSSHAEKERNNMKIKEFIKTNIDIDFEENNVSVYVYKVYKVFFTKKEQEEKDNNTEKQLYFNDVFDTEDENDIDEDEQKITDEQKSLIENLAKERPQLLLSKKFEVSADYKTVIIDGKNYQIPDFFNTETIKENDIKTWEMIFYDLFEKEINHKIKTLLKEQSSYIINKLTETKSDSDEI